MSRQIWPFCCCLVFRCPAQSDLIFVFQNLTPGGVGVSLPKTLPQMRVSREAILTTKSLHMSIRAHSLLDFFNFGCRYKDISIDSDLPQVSICVNSPAESFNSRLSELPFLDYLFLSSSLYLSEGDVDLSNHYITFCEFRGRQMLVFRPVRACFFISKHHQHRVSI